MSSTRWRLGVALAAAAVTAVALGAALADADAGPIRTLLGVAIVAFLLSVAAAGLWGVAVHRVRSDAIVDRARTTSKLAHEMKNPLMSIKGLASTGGRLFDEMSDDERREFFRLIDQEAARLQRVVEQSATAMRLEAGQIVYDFQAEGVGALVEQAATTSAHDAHPLSVRTEPETVARIDRRYLGEAIANLVENASNYSPPDAPIDVSTRRDGRDVVIEVADRGPGVPPERRASVFERFSTWRPAGYEETPGAGLGLFIARAHVLAHGGTIVIEERDDGGSILRVTLPGEG
jgi:signal transduction histidine kinase